uniref:Response regulatory domain-containing protein n=1 Tax=Eutreptiella gymnastica TaxID=73025 RepID=A0A7S1IQJ3_9EUGL
MFAATGTGPNMLGQRSIRPVWHNAGIYVEIVLCFALAVLFTCSRRSWQYVTGLISLFVVISACNSMWVYEMASRDTLADAMAEVLHLSPCFELDPNSQAAREGIEHLLMTLIVRHSISMVSTMSLCLFMIVSVVDYSKIPVLSCLVSTLIFIGWVLQMAIRYDVQVWQKITFHVLVCCIIPLTITQLHAQQRRMRFHAERENDRTLRVSRDADSILNHTLKNVLADSSGQIILLLGQCPMLPDKDRYTLEMSVATLQRGILACRHRQTYIDLMAGRYVAKRSPVRVWDLIADLSKGRSVTLHWSPIEPVLLDTVLISLILENALSNASKHGNPTDPDVHISVERRLGNQLMFQVSNCRNPNGPHLTSAYVDSMFSGLDREMHRPSSDPTSTGIGLQHTNLAARALGSTLTLVEVRDRVLFEVHVPFLPLEVGADYPSDLDMDITAFPSGLRFCCIDDSEISLTIMKDSFQKRAQAGDVQTFGAGGAADAHLFVQAALRDAHIAVLDSNLDYPREVISGANLVSTLRTSGFKGLLCMRSGNTSDEDCERYRQAGCHCIVGKDLPMSKAMDHIKAAYLRLAPMPHCLIPLAPTHGLPNVACSFPNVARSTRNVVFPTPRDQNRVGWDPTGPGGSGAWEVVSQ